MNQDALSKDISGADAVDAILEQWRVQRPDLDATAKAVTGRIVRLASLFQQRYNEAFEQLGLKEGDYGLLAALRRSGEPFALTPTELARSQMMSSGGMTFVVDRLERLGLVAREPNPADRRGTLVTLTSDGRAAVDQAMSLHVEVERELVEALTASEQTRLVGLLRKLLLGVDRR